MKTFYSNKEPIQLNEICRVTGKRIFYTYEQASHLINFMKGRSGGHAHWGSNKKLKHKKIVKRVYKCPFCGNWHTTSLNQKEYDENIKELN